MSQGIAIDSLRTEERNSIADAGDPEWIAVRLDAIDQVLMGVLPRQERLAVVGDIENRLRMHNQSEQNGTMAPAFPVTFSTSLAQHVKSAQPVLSPTVAVVPIRRSRIAFASGVNGIAALILSGLCPFMWVAALVLSNYLSGGGFLLVMGSFFVIFAVTSGIAFFGGIIGLVRTRKVSGRTGRGWALTGILSSVVPMALFAGLVLWGISEGIIDMGSLFRSRSAQLPELQGSMSDSDDDFSGRIEEVRRHDGFIEVYDARGRLKYRRPVEEPKSDEELASENNERSRLWLESLKDAIDQEDNMRFSTDVGDDDGGDATLSYDEDRDTTRVGPPHFTSRTRKAIPNRSNRELMPNPIDPDFDSDDDRPAPPAEPTLIPVDPESETTD